jgi:hypothetical protein
MNTITRFDSKSLPAALKAITRNDVAARNNIQAVATWAVVTSIENGDVSVGNLLLDALGATKMVRKDSLIAHLERYGNFAWIPKEKVLKFFLNKRTGCTDGNLTPEYAALISSKSWDEAKRETTAVSEYDMEAQLRIFITRMEKHCIDPAIKVVNRDVLQAVSNEFARINAVKVLASIKPMDKAETKVAKGKAIDAALKPKPMTNRQALVAKLKDEALPVIDQKLVAVG